MRDSSMLGSQRRQYDDDALNESDILASPMAQFKQWLDEWCVFEEVNEVAMVLSTVDADGYPDSRVVLLKSLEHDEFVFYTHYLSAKGEQIAHNPHVALNFYWPRMSRQVRVRGVVRKTSAKQSDDYFASRPLASQVSALVSAQSQCIPDRASLEKAYVEARDMYVTTPIKRPSDWGGFTVTPDCMEFWQGRVNRLSDRIQYQKHQGMWTHHRLAP